MHYQDITLRVPFNPGPQDNPSLWDWKELAECEAEVIGFEDVVSIRNLYRLSLEGVDYECWAYHELDALHELAEQVADDIKGSVYEIEDLGPAHES